MKTKLLHKSALILGLVLSAGVACAVPQPPQPGGPGGLGQPPQGQAFAPLQEPATQQVTINGIPFTVSASYQFFTWQTLPGNVVLQSQPLKSFTAPDGSTHWYEAVYNKNGNLNWFQAAKLAESGGGYLACISSAAENRFVFSLVADRKYFWQFPAHREGDIHPDHHGIMIGPFLGGYQRPGAAEPAGGWSWLSGEPWGYADWAKNLDDGVIDKDPRPNDQPNDSGQAQNQRVMGFGEMNVPVATWGDYMDDVGTYGRDRLPGRAYGFVIEYDHRPAGRGQ